MNNLVFTSINKTELEDLIENSVRRVLQEKNTIETRTSLKEVINIKEACEMLQLAKPTIYAMTSKNLIPHYKRGKKLYFKKTELMDWLAEGKKKTPSELASEIDDLIAGTHKSFKS